MDFHQVSRVARTDRQVPKVFHRYLLGLAETVYQPVFNAKPEDRWPALQQILIERWTTALEDLPPYAEGDEPERPDDPVEALARSLARLFDESEPESELLQRGADYRRRRTRLLRRRGDALAGVTTAMSITASQGFVWALLYIALSGFYAQQSSLDLDGAYEFVVYVLERGGADQYRLLRVAENELIDREDEEHLVHEGDLSPLDERMERDTHVAWLDLPESTVR